MIDAAGGGPIRPTGPTETHILAGVIITICVLAVLGYYGQQLQWWLQDRRKEKEQRSADRDSSGQV